MCILNRTWVDLWSEIVPYPGHIPLFVWFCLTSLVRACSSVISTPCLKSTTNFSATNFIKMCIFNGTWVDLWSEIVPYPGHIHLFVWFCLTSLVRACSSVISTPCLKSTTNFSATNFIKMCIFNGTWVDLWSEIAPYPGHIHLFVWFCLISLVRACSSVISMPGLKSTTNFSATNFFTIFIFNDTWVELWSEIVAYPGHLFVWFCSTSLV